MTYYIKPVDGYDIPKLWLDAARQIGEGAFYCAYRTRDGEKIYKCNGSPEIYEQFNKIIKPMIGDS